MHILNARYNNDHIEKVKWHLLFYVYNKQTKTFEKQTNNLSASNLVIAIKNTWYEGSDLKLNYGNEFLQKHFDLEAYVETWKTHPELNAKLSNSGEEYLKNRTVNESSFWKSSFSYMQSSMKYFKLKQELYINNANVTLDQIKTSSFMFVNHIYASTVGVEMKLSSKLDKMDLAPCKIELKLEPDLATQKTSTFFNKRYWKLKNENVDSSMKQTLQQTQSKKFRSMELKKMTTQKIYNYRKQSLYNRFNINEQ